MRSGKPSLRHASRLARSAKATAETRTLPLVHREAVGVLKRLNMRSITHEGCADRWRGKLWRDGFDGAASVGCSVVKGKAEDSGLSSTLRFAAPAGEVPELALRVQPIGLRGPNSTPKLARVPDVAAR